MTPAPLRMLDSGTTLSVLHPLRRRILEGLAEPGSASSLARRFGLPRQKINYHLRELEGEGLLELVEERRKGNCVERVLRARAATYYLDPSILGMLGADPGRIEDRLSSTYLIALAARTIRETSALSERAAAAGKRVATLSLDAEIRFRSAAERNAFGEEMAAALAGLIARYHDDRMPGGRSFRIVLGAHPAFPEPARPPGPAGEVKRPGAPGISAASARGRPSPSGTRGGEPAPRPAS